VEDVRNQYKKTEKYVSLRPAVVMTKEEVQAEVLRVLLGRISPEDTRRISENLDIQPEQLRSMMPI
jgi:hypothetical protein